MVTPFQNDQTPIFVVSSGRTGSTFLGKMLNRHPDIVCMGDLIEPTGPNPYFDRSDVVSGEHFFKLLSAPSIKPRLRFWKDRPTDELMFYPKDDGNHVSLLLCYTLPKLTDDPVALLNTIEADFSQVAPATMADHTVHFFELIRERMGKKLWVECTGGNLPQTKGIVETWPDAKIIHNFRDCREVAISMQTKSFFRMYRQIEENPDLDEWDFDDYPPYPVMGAMLNRWVMQAEDLLEGIPAERRHATSYESYTEQPHQALLSLCQFIFDREEPLPQDVAWVEGEMKNIRKAPLRFDALDKEAQIELELSCRDALVRLGYPLKAISAEH